MSLGRGQRAAKGMKQAVTDPRQLLYA